MGCAFIIPFRGNRGRTPTGRARLAFGLALVAIFVHSLFYNALIEDPLFWAALALSAVAYRETEKAVIGGWKRALVLAPHTDDGEFGCGGTMARLVEDGADVRYVAFSIATRSLPEGFPPDTLRHEVAAATAELGIPSENLTVHDFDVRTFPDHRQEILELLIEIWNDWEPDVVFQPSLHDIHQDHQAIATEGLRAFKRTTILGYEIPWNNLDFAYQAYISLERAPPRPQGRRARPVRLPAAPPLRRPGVHPQPRPHPRDEREPRVRRGVPGVSRDRIEKKKAPR